MTCFIALIVFFSMPHIRTPSRTFSTDSVRAFPCTRSYPVKLSILHLDTCIPPSNSERWASTFVVLSLLSLLLVPLLDCVWYIALRFSWCSYSPLYLPPPQADYPNCTYVCNPHESAVPKCILRIYLTISCPGTLASLAEPIPDVD